MSTATPTADLEHGDARRYWRGCRCDDCRHAASRRATQSKYLRQTGRGTICSPNRAAHHVHKLRLAGMIDAQIQGAADISSTTLHRIVSRRGAIRRSVEARVLSVPVAKLPTVASKARTDPTGTARRLQALAAAGWSVSALAARTTLLEKDINRLRAQRSAFVTLSAAARVSALFTELWDQRPESHGVSTLSATRTRRNAAERDWHPALAWDDIDDPREVPQHGDRSPRAGAIVEDTAELVRQGLSRDAIAARLGITWNAVTKAHSQTGLPTPELAA